MTKLPCVNLFQISSAYGSAKYYLNWFTVGKVITKIKMINLTQRRSSSYMKVIGSGQG